MLVIHFQLEHISIQLVSDLNEGNKPSLHFWNKTALNPKLDTSADTLVSLFGLYRANTCTFNKSSFKMFSLVRLSLQNQ